MQRQEKRRRRLAVVVAIIIECTKKRLKKVVCGMMMIFFFFVSVFDAAVHCHHPWTFSCCRRDARHFEAITAVMIPLEIVSMSL